MAPLPLAPSPSLTHLFTTINSTLGHTRYAISGRAALAAHGLSIREPDHITLLCPRRDIPVLLAWMRSSSWNVTVQPAWSDKFNVYVPVPAGPTWRVRLRGVDETEWHLLGVETRCGGRVVGLVGLLEHFARVWTEMVVRDGKGVNYLREEEVAGVVLRILERIWREGIHVPRERVPRVLDERWFWTPFVVAHPEGRWLLERAGLDRPDGWF